MTAGFISTHVVRGLRVALFVVTIGWMFVSFGCAYSPPHPPTYADFRRIGPGILEDDKKLNAELAVFAAAMFSSADIKVIQAKGGTHELVGAALHARVGDENTPALTRAAFLRGSNDPVVLTGVAASLLREIGNDAQGPGGTDDLFKVLTALEKIEADNGLPLCVRAYVRLKQGDTNAARLFVKAAAQKPSLRLRGSELRHCVNEAAIAVKYPRYTASILAVGTISMGTQLSVVSRKLLNDPQLDRATAEACLELGRQHEAQATLFIDQLTAFSMQTRALEFLKPSGFENEMQRMQEAKDKIKKAIAFLDSAKAHAASERQWLAYFETLFTKSESEAVDLLALMLNYKL